MTKNILIILLYFFVISCTTKTKVYNYQSGTDFHMHIHSPPKVKDDMEFTADRALMAAESIELSRVVVVSNAYYKNVTEAEAVKENNFVAQEASKHKEKVAGACAVNPAKPWAAREIMRCNALGFKILKLHFLSSGLDLRRKNDFETASKAIAAAEQFKYTVLVHANYPKTSRGNEAHKLVALINKFPNTRWIIGHMLGREYELLKQISHTNYFAEVSVAPIWMKTPETQDQMLRLMRDVGMEKFIFGSDWPVIHPAEMKKALKKLKLTTYELYQVEFLNASQFDDLFTTNPI